MKKTIFISSTFKDLEVYRKQVWHVLQKHDVIVTGMEQFGARKSNPLDTCIVEVMKADVYIGIIGMVYGSIDKNTGKSYTQLEYEAALKPKLQIHYLKIIYGKNSLE